jgi:hypothetical protein
MRKKDDPLRTLASYKYRGGYERKEGENLFWENSIERRK